MKRRKFILCLSIVLLCALLLNINSLANEDTLVVTDLESILANALPGELGGVCFSLEKGLDEGTGLGKMFVPSAVKNVYPYLSYASDNIVEFYPPPRNDFTIGIDPLHLNTYFAILNHDVLGMKVYHILYSTSGGRSYYFEMDVPDFIGYPGQLWRFTIYWSSGAPDIPGSYIYLAFVLPYDGDGYKFNPKARFPVNIHY